MSSTIRNWVANLLAGRVLETYIELAGYLISIQSQDGWNDQADIPVIEGWNFQVHPMIRMLRHHKSADQPAFRDTVFDRVRLQVWLPSHPC